MTLPMKPRNRKTQQITVDLEDYMDTMTELQSRINIYEEIIKEKDLLISNQKKLIGYLKPDRK